MTTRPPGRQTARRPVPITAQQVADLADCRCSLLPGTHQALHCAQRREAADVAAETVPCWFGCGYFATSEADLNEHEAGCEQADLRETTFDASTEEFLAALDELAARGQAPRRARLVGRDQRNGGVQS